MEEKTAFKFPKATWRLIDDQAYPVQLGLAIDDALFESMDRPEFVGSNVVRFYQFSPPSVVVGCHQDIKEIDTGYVQERGLQVGRRITGGGAIIMGVPTADAQLGISVVVRNPPGFPVKMGGKYAVLSRAIVTGLDRLGLKVKYQQNSDITMNDKKITGQAMLATSTLTFLHSTITIDYDLDTILRVMKIVPDKETLGRFKGKFTTIKEHVQTITMSALKKALVAGFEKEYNARLEARGIDDGEMQQARKLLAEKHSTPGYIYNLDGTAMGSCFL
nr:hypothetical protein [Candidatus Sigynarchaeota archaeon]